MTVNQVWRLDWFLTAHSKGFIQRLTDTSTVSNIHTAVDASESTLGFGAFQRNTLASRLSTFQVDDHKFVDTTRVWSICYFGVSECLPGSFRLVKNRTGAPRGCDSYIQLAGERSLGQARATIPLWGCIRKGIQRKSAKSNHLLCFMAEDQQN